MRPHHLLALLPVLGILIGVPFANHVHRYVLGMPFLLFWIVLCVVSTAAVMALITALDDRAAAPSDDRDPARRWP